MLFGLFKRPDARIDALYATIVTHARHPVFYRDLGVPDTVEGRFELLVAVAGQVVTRLSAGSEADRQLARILSETFFSDMDRSLREMGISDTGVPRRMKSIAQAFYGRVTAYEAALSAGSVPELEAALVRNVYDGTAAPGAAGLAARLLDLHRALAAAAPEAILSGRFVFPDPSTSTDSLP